MHHGHRFYVSSACKKTWKRGLYSRIRKEDWYSAPNKQVLCNRLSRKKQMAGSLNKVQLIGNLGRDPEMRQTQDGKKIATFSMATTETWKDRMTGERRDRTEWHRVVIFNERLSEIVEQYLRKGSKIYLEGQLQTRKWTDQQGIEKYTTEVVLSQFKGELTMLGGRNDNADPGTSAFPADEGTMGSFGPAASAASGSASGAASPSPATPPVGEPELDDEVPF